MKRLYLEYQPDEEGLAYLQGLQENASISSGSASLIDSKQLHVTLIHFGIVQRAYDELQAVVPDLPRAVYMAAVDRFADDVRKLLPQTLYFKDRQLALYGHGPSVLVLELEPDTETVAVQRRCVHELSAFFSRCGITNPEAYMRANHNFKHALNFRPHISLLRNVRQMPNLDLQQEKLHVSLVPLGYDMRYGRYT